MRLDRKTKTLAIAGVLAIGGAVAAVAGAGGGGLSLTGVPTANTKSDGYAPASMLSPELRQIVIAQGSTRVENPSAGVSYYGYDNDTLNAAGQPQMVPTPTTPTEAQKTEPDKNTYLVFKNGLSGADPSYDYGDHFLFQGHEVGTPGYITRINLDADAAHRVTVLATQDTAGHTIADIDGSTWDPWAQRLLLTTESAGAPIYSATPGYPSTVEDVSGALGRGGYEGIQNDSDGNIWIVEDIGGSNKPGTTAKIPNSFIYRYVPQKPGDLHNGKLQVLQVLNAAGAPITQASQTALMSPDQVALHTYGSVFSTQWVTIHDTAVDGNTSFNANDAAKAHDGTPFKRPENGQFRPGSGFKEFYFDETGDTNATSVENACCGGWDSVFKLTQKNPSASTGQLSIFFRGDQAHAGFDNVAFFSKNLVTFVEDAGDTLHSQRNALDSGFVFDATKDYSNPANQPVRWLAEGRDASATLDSANSGFGKNEGDNEITGIHVSNGDPSKNGILGAQIPQPWQSGGGEDDQGDDNDQGGGSGGAWRVFYTQQHGDNPTYEVVRR
jgi:hypothetical protein